MARTVTQRKQQTAGHNGSANGYFPIRFILDQERDGFTIPETARTLEGFREWSWSDECPHEGRISFIDGEIIADMSKERFDAHVLVKGEVYRVLANLVKKEDLGIFFPDGTGVTNIAANISHVPDGGFASWKSFEAGIVRKVFSKAVAGGSLELEGTPDLVIEVVSPSSVTKDTKVLLKSYCRAGIPEYWLVDARGDTLRFTIHRLHENAYLAQPAKSGWIWSPVFKRHFRLSRSKDRIGGWRYQLDVKK
ncbi:MAG: Uma2 family endonuclease [Gemmataceae bacterium]|nr:Uma2 family endonuclease [Gemmataceae bacterium]